MARYCKNCGSPVTSDGKFCHNCGTALSTAAVQTSTRKRTGDSKQLSKETSGQKTREPDLAASQDADITKYCRFCGNPVREGAKFCRHCGQSLSADVSRQETPRQVNTPARQPGAGQTTRQTELPDSLSGADAPPKEQPSKRTKTKTGQAQKSSERKPKKAASTTAGAAKEAGSKQAEMKPQITTLAAAATGGEIDLGELVIPGMTRASGAVTEVLSPVSGILHSIGSYLGGIFSIFKNPSALIGTLLLAGLWFVLAWLRGSDSEIVKALSWITYADGGFDRKGLGIVGGVFGKGMVAAALVSFFTGGFKRVFKGIGVLFAGSGEKRGIINILLGVVIGAAVYLAFVGPDNASGKTAMVGISGVLLSLEALGGSGKLYELAQSLTSRVTNGVREVARGKCEGLLTGLTIGFTLAAVISLFA